MPPIAAAKDDLAVLERAWKRITTIPPKPRSLLDVLNYSLSSQGQGEVFMTRILRYLLDPSEPHGMEADFLQSFLDGLSSHQRDRVSRPKVREFDEDTFDLSDVEVRRQIRTGWSSDEAGVEMEPAGQPDLLVESPGEWFLLIELKFAATENNLRGEGLSQTELYYETSHVAGRPKDEYESGGYYLYLHRQGKPDAKDPHFTNWTWGALERDVLPDFIADNSPRYPHRTVVQMREIHDDIRELSGMTEHQQNQQEKIELYLDHYDAIKDVTEAFDERWSSFAEDWAGRFTDMLSEAGYGELVDVGEQLAGIDLERESGPERWIFRAQNSDWAHLMKDGWWRRTGDLATIYDRPSNREDARVGFYHRLEANRDLAIGENTLELTFRNMGANDDEFIEGFNQNFRSREDDIAKRLPESTELASITDTKRNLFSATYDIEPDQHDDFFTAYLAALQEGFAELVVDNEALVDLIDEAYEESLELYR